MAGEGGLILDLCPYFAYHIVIIILTTAGVENELFWVMTHEIFQ